jgi:hypothetical protein
MACIREGNADLVRKAVVKACASASHGVRCMIVMEKGPTECPRGEDIMKPPRQHAGTVERRLVLELPKGRTLWAGTHGWNGAWILDTEGMYQGTAEEGARDTPRSPEGVAAGYSKYHLEAVLYAPQTGPQCMPTIIEPLPFGP